MAKRHWQHRDLESAMVVVKADTAEIKAAQKAR